MGAIRIAEGSEACAMAGMLGSVLEENIKENPRKKAIFRAMNTVVVIQVVDIDLAITLDFSYGRLTIYEGVEMTPHIRIKTESAHVLELSNEAKKETEEKEKNWVRRERAYSKYYRQIQLPTKVDPKKAKAKFNNGMLELEIPKSEQITAYDVKIE